MAEMMTTEFHQFFANHPEATFLLDGSNHIQAANEKGALLFGADFLNQPFSRLFADDVGITNQPPPGLVFPQHMLSLQNQFYQLEVNALESGGHVVVVRDVTENTLALNELESRFKVTADCAPVMVWMSRTDKFFDWVNKPWLQFTGRTMEQECGNGWEDVVHPEDFKRCLEIYTRAFDARQSFTMDYRLRRHDGMYRWVVDNGAPRYSADGEFTGFIGSCIDIHERKDLEQQLKIQSRLIQQATLQKDLIISESESFRRLYETILANTPDFVYVFDLEHRFTYANPELLRMFGRTWDEAIGKSFLELGYEAWHADMHKREIDQVKLTKRAIRGEVPFDGAFGRRIYDYIFTPVIGPNGEVEAVAGTTRDITDRHQIEETLRKSQEALQMAGRRKDEFLAMLAHELRNPLAPISAASQIMVLGDLNHERVKKSSQIIERQVRHMVGLVDDLLDVSRVTRGLVTIDKSPQDMKAIISHSIEQVRPIIETKRHHLLVEVDPEPAHVLGDHKRLVQIISNILNNAAKYTPEGGNISVSMHVQNGNVMIEIADNGIGIAMEEQEHIFDLFAQAKRSSDRSQGGLGIGLALVRSMLKLHDGNVMCASQGLGCGTNFTVTLPLMETNASGSGLVLSDWAMPIAEKRLKVLVVDDNLDAASTLASLLELNGHQVMVEHDAKHALESANADIPDVCILDIGLPGMDGNELARCLRTQEKTAHIRLIAVTGYGQEHDRQTAIASGFDYYMVKPVDVSKLTDLLSG